MDARTQNQDVTTQAAVDGVKEITLPTDVSINDDALPRLDAANDVWKTMSDYLNHAWNACKETLNLLGDKIEEGAKKTWLAICLCGRKIFLPISMSGINIIGYLIDKVLFGLPALRPYLHDGCIPSTIPDNWREFVRKNAGWDIYESMHPVINNVLGILGGGIGFLNFATHLCTSIALNIATCWHLLGSNGFFGGKKVLADKRNMPVKIIFGILSLPFVIPTVILTNIADGSLTFIKNFFLSFGRNLGSIFNLLGENGVFGKRLPFKDTRSLPAKIVYGILSAPLVGIAALFTNIIDGILTFGKNFFLSFGRNLRSIFNLLGDNGVFGKRISYKDDRKSKAAKIIFGILSAPLVGIAALFTNIVDGILAFGKNFFLSFGRNLRSTFNLLGDNGVFGARRSFADKRELLAKIVYGILSAPLVAITAIVTNIIDGILAFGKNFFLSFGHNIRSTFNIVLGENGIFGPRRPLADKRESPAKIVYGILSAPLVTITAFVSNIFDITLLTFKNFGLSFWRNLRSTFNLLGENGVFGKRIPYTDDRKSKATKIIFGILSAPLVGIAALFTNIIDGILAFTKNFFLSFGHNLRSTFNIILGNDGVFGARRSLADKRELPAKIVYGILSAPLVAVSAIVTNILDGILSFGKNFFISLGHNLRCTFNLLGKTGVFGARRPLADKRELPAKIVYGILSAPLVAVAAIVTNVLDGILTFGKNFFLSFGRNLRRTFNIVLGENGVFGLRRPLADKRELPAKIVYGILSAPFVATIALLSNIADLIGSYFKHYKQTIKKPALIITGISAAVLFALPVFMIRKTIKGFYNCMIRPIIDCKKGNSFHPTRLLGGVLNIISLGLFSGVKKIFKACAGYTKRFGFTAKGKSEKQPLIINSFQSTQATFRDAIHLATKGKFPGAKDGLGIFRPFTRIFYGMRHQSEKILKSLHDAYLCHAKSLKSQKISQNTDSYKMHTFFRSPAFLETKGKIAANLKQGEEKILSAVERRLCPNPS